MRFVLELQRAVTYSVMPSTGRHILLTLAIKADWETGVVPAEHGPSLTTLAAMTGLSKSTVAEWLDVLETFGWVKRDRPPRGSRDERTSYALLVGSSYVQRPHRASRRPADPVGSPPAGPDPAGMPPVAGAVRPADRPHMGDRPPLGSPPGGIPAVRPADTSGPPGGHASIKNSPSESSTSRGRSARPRGADGRTAGGTVVAKPRRGTRIAPDFPITDDMIDWARTETPNVGRTATAAFIDHWTHQSGEHGERADWQYEWRAWMRREQKFLERSPSFRGTPVQTAVDAVPAPRPAPGEVCPTHRSGYTKANCGLCRADAYLAPWDSLPAATEPA